MIKKKKSELNSTCGSPLTMCPQLWGWCVLHGKETGEDQRSLVMCGPSRGVIFFFSPHVSRYVPLKNTKGFISEIKQKRFGLSSGII
jgi:hypothetical protein